MDEGKTSVHLHGYPFEQFAQEVAAAYIDVQQSNIPEG